LHRRASPQLELGVKSLQRQWYFVLRRGKVGRRQACERQNFSHDTITPNPLTRNGRRVLCFQSTGLSSFAMPNLPNCQSAIIESAKLRDYCLSPDHPRGRHKARVFREALGLSINDAEWLQQNLLDGIQKHPAEKEETDSFGSRWRVDLPLARQGKSAVVRTGWIIKTGEQLPRLITCWVL
jgi:hypothetical protein